jgi:hypothetical protein
MRKRWTAAWTVVGVGLAAALLTFAIWGTTGKPKRAAATEAADDGWTRVIACGPAVVSLRASRKENEGGRINLKRDGREWRWETDFCLGFGKPCVIGGGKGQIVIITYSGLGGTGVGLARWWILRPQRDEPDLHKMGTWRSWCWGWRPPGNYGYTFSIDPNLLSSGPNHEPAFRFTYVARDEQGERTITGSIYVKEVSDGRRVKLALTPCTVYDARACMTLLGSEDGGPRYWAADCLKTICPAEVHAHRLAAKAGAKQRDDALRELREAVERFYN